jgi:hypothetical protein
MVGQRQRYGDLAVVLLAKLPAILPRHPNRMLTLLGTGNKAETIEISMLSHRAVTILSKTAVGPRLARLFGRRGKTGVAVVGANVNHSFALKSIG